MIDVNTLKVTELKAELTSRGLSTKGLKKELITRLEEAYAAEEKGITSHATEPDVAPKSSESSSTDPDHTTAEASTEAEDTDISEVVEPIAEPSAASAESDIVTAPTPVAAPTASSTTLDPVVGTPTLTMEGVIDTTTSGTAADASDNSSKKRSLSETQTEGGGTTESSKRLRPLESRDDIIAAATASIEADTRRRSTAPSPSPAPHSSASRNSISISSTVTEASPSTTSGSPSEDRPTGATLRKFDARSLMEKQVKIAAMDRTAEDQKSEAVSKAPQQESPHPPESTEAKHDTADSEPRVSTRSLVITNFVRPLTVNQVKRMLSEYGEIEVLWMDNIRTHCYVTYKDDASADKAFEGVDGQVFPKETGKALKPYSITPEAAATSIANAEAAQNAGKRPVIFTGKEAVPAVPAALATRASAAAAATEATAPARSAALTSNGAEAKVEPKVEQQQVPVINVALLFKMTEAKPALYYKALKEPPSAKAPTPSNDGTPVAETN
ncbi:hypothetical protein BGZ94_010338 [Podila epigama]|nr:hypothetical protein BGZ94_010338 [Podila epigama]